MCRSSGPGPKACCQLHLDAHWWLIGRSAPSYSLVASTKCSRRRKKADWSKSPDLMAAGAPLLPLEPPRAGLPQPPCPAWGRSSSQLAVSAFSPLSACCGGLRCFWQAGLACNNFWPLVGSYNSSVVKYKLAESGVLPSAAGRLRWKGVLCFLSLLLFFLPQPKGMVPLLQPGSENGLG